MSGWQSGPMAIDHQQRGAADNSFCGVCREGKKGNPQKEDMKNNENTTIRHGAGVTDRNAMPGGPAMDNPAGGKNGNAGGEIGHPIDPSGMGVSIDTNPNSTATPRAVSGVAEWATDSLNIQTGCSNDCRYCYAKSFALRFKRSTASDWKRPTLNPKAVHKAYKKRTGRTMFPTSHDITRENLDACITVLGRLTWEGNRVLIVSNPEPFCIAALVRALDHVPEYVTFRFSIGSTDDQVLGYWEPFAPKFEQRMESLRIAHAAGFATSVSCEPMLDSRIDLVIEAVRPFVTDSIWLGRVNNLMNALALNCPGDEESRARGRALLAEMSDARMLALYDRYKSDPVVRFKDSVKKVAGLQRPTEAGLDV